MLDSVAAQRSVLFLDEVDSWAAASRSSTTHEETAAQLSVLLEFIDGVDRGRSSNCIVVAATNRPDRVDAALRSRMRILTFPAPSLGSAIEWWTRNAAHLSRSEIRDLATVGQTVAHASFRTLERTARRAEELAALQAQRQRQPQPAAPSLLQYRAALAAAAETALKQQEATRAAAKL
ncbi:hypothetical protein DIPPA_06615 [Diplonema papillatum]|nr:hypothetical protein DIPPA_06615 [Diplonema papillatum]